MLRIVLVTHGQVPSNQRVKRNARGPGSEACRFEVSISTLTEIFLCRTPALDREMVGVNRHFPEGQQPFRNVATIAIQFAPISQFARFHIRLFAQLQTPNQVLKPRGHRGADWNGLPARPISISSYTSHNHYPYLDFVLGPKQTSALQPGRYSRRGLST